MPVYQESLLEKLTTKQSAARPAPAAQPMAPPPLLSANPPPTKPKKRRWLRTVASLLLILAVGQGFCLRHAYQAGSMGEDHDAPPLAGFTVKNGFDFGNVSAVKAEDFKRHVVDYQQRLSGLDQMIEEARANKPDVTPFFKAWVNMLDQAKTLQDPMQRLQYVNGWINLAVGYDFLKGERAEAKREITKNFRSSASFEETPQEIFSNGGTATAAAKAFLKRESLIRAGFNKKDVSVVIVTELNKIRPEHTSWPFASRMDKDPRNAVVRVKQGGQDWILYNQRPPSATLLATQSKDLGKQALLIANCGLFEEARSFFSDQGAKIMEQSQRWIIPEFEVTEGGNILTYRAEHFMDGLIFTTPGKNGTGVDFHLLSQKLTTKPNPPFPSDKAYQALSPLNDRGWFNLLKADPKAPLAKSVFDAIRMNPLKQQGGAEPLSSLTPPERKLLTFTAPQLLSPPTASQS